MKNRHPRRATMLLLILPAAAAIAWAGLGGCSVLTRKAHLGLVCPEPDGRGFVEQFPRRHGTKLRPFVPFGTNYYDPNTGWAPKLWRQFDPNRVAEHFRVMNELGVNCARVFLTAATFQPDVNTVDERALRKLDKLVEIARDARIRLIVTGPDHWEGVPAYWKPDRFAGSQSRRALERFWSVVARRYRLEPAIFAWDLLNEPHLPWFVESWRPQWNAWLHRKYGSWPALKATYAGELGADESWQSVAVPKNEPDSGNPRLRDWQLFREHLADEWVRRQVEAIRHADNTARVTVGYIQWSYPLVRSGKPGRYSAFNPRRQAQWLDFVSIHFYPTLGGPFDSPENWEKNLAYLRSVLAYCHTDKPVVLSEYGWYGGGAPRGQRHLDEAQQARWLTAEVEASRRLAHGWLSWPFADTPSSTDISIYAGLVTQRMTPKQWGRCFQAYAARLSTLPQPTPVLPDVDITKALTTPAAELAPMHERYAGRIEATLTRAGPVPPIRVPATVTGASDQTRK